MKCIRLIPLLFCLPLAVQAQQADDTSVFRNFELIANKTNGNNPGTVRINLPLTNTGSLAEAVSLYSALFVKYYSPTSLATTSMRGMGAQHTAVLWNGINLQSSMNGVIDFNLLPSFFIDQAVIETGANASGSANGAIAGAVYLDNKLNNRNTVFTEMQIGSFNSRSSALGFTATIRKWAFRSRALYKSADNDFEYANYFIAGKPLEKLSHSKFMQYGAMQEVSFRPNKRHLIYLNGWRLETFRQLPPPMGAASQNEKQEDFSTKAILQHDFRIGKEMSENMLISKLAFLDEQINYFNDLLKPARSRAKIMIAESEIRIKLNKQLDFSGSLNFTQQHGVSSDGYPDGKLRRLLSVWTRLEYKTLNEKLRFSIANRQLLADGHMAPSSPDLGFEYRVFSFFRLKGNVAYSFRLPSFNDLYWFIGGNSQLRPEQAKKAEMSAEIKLQNFKFSATTFYHQVNNWILWNPDPQTSIWVVNNAKQVESRGVEIASEYNRVILVHHAVKIFGRYQFVNSINTEVYAEDHSALGKQLFYTPVHTGFAQLRYAFRNIQFNFGASYTGSRFTTTDNNPDYMLPQYVVLNTGMAFLFKYKQHNSSLHFNVGNLGNATYQVIENRPMPLRNYQLTLKININYDKN